MPEPRSAALSLAGAVLLLLAVACRPAASAAAPRGAVASPASDSGELEWAGYDLRDPGSRSWQAELVASFEKQDGRSRDEEPEEPGRDEEEGSDDSGDEAEEGEEDDGERTGRGSGRRGRGARDAEREAERQEREAEERRKRKGIPVTDALVRKYCVTCHQDHGEGKLSRISFMRKSPEGWSLSLERMKRLYHLVIPEEDAKAMLRYLANDHGLARSEAERALYDAERRVHWSEEQHDQELRETCGECHSLGRVFAEYRDPKEWNLLKATHLAFFPSIEFQAFRGRRPRGPQGAERGGDDEDGGDGDGESGRGGRGGGPDRADRVLGELAEAQPIFTPAWDTWTVNRREVPVEGAWTVIGTDPTRGRVLGTLTVTRTGPDEFETRWELTYGSEAPLVRAGKGVLYAGFSWRGTSETFAPGEAPLLRETLLLSEDWSTMKGRIFTGEYHELGVDVTLHRRAGTARVFDAVERAVMIGSESARLELLGTGFTRDLAPGDFHLGQGVTVTGVEVEDAERLTLTLRVARDARRGPRQVSLRAVPGPEALLLYDTVDYVKITPEQGLSRVGGEMRGKMLERFQAVAVNRGFDDELYTADDFVVRRVEATWGLAEFPVREDDDDLEFVGAIDSATGVFTPALDGPNPERRWSANNIGDVYVTAECTLTVREMPEPADGDEGAAPPDDAPIVMIERTFRARGHLLVTVPLYVNWADYEASRR